MTVNNTAEFARVGYMNLVTKAGTNQFHGQAAYWNQNSALAARQFFDDAKAKVLIHTISVSASGPVIKKQAFLLCVGEHPEYPQQTVLPSGRARRMRCAAATSRNC